MTGFVHSDGKLILAEWARRVASEGADRLQVHTGQREHPMYGTTGTGDSLVSNGHLGVDLIRVPAGGGFAPHTHPGDHLLIVVAGEGTITYEGRIYPTRAGQVYMVEGEVPHAVGAVTDHCILAVGSPHRPVDSADRMTLSDYAAVATEFGHLTCLACEMDGTPEQLEAKGCPHVPVKPGAGKLLCVGIAPAGPQHVGQRAFVGTRSGDRLAALLGVPGGQLADVVDSLNVFPAFLGDWQRISRTAWRDAARELLPILGGRVVVACGKAVAETICEESIDTWGQVTCVTRGLPHVRPFLVLTIPHPSGLSRAWNDPATTATVTRALAVARSLAAAGSPTGDWADRDAAALQSITLPALVDL